MNGFVKAFGPLARVVALLGAALVLAASPAHAQGSSPTTSPAALSGTLAKVRASGTIALGFRESSIPFSYLSTRNEPIGYSIELCRALVSAIEDAVNKSLAVKWVPVTAASRIDAVANGQIDLECGSTTSNVERQKRVGFSPTIFVSGTKLMVKNGSPVRSIRDLKGKKVVVTAGTTNEKTMRDLDDKFGVGMDIVVSRDHAESFGLLSKGQVDAFATDDVLLYGLLAQNAAKGEFTVLGDFLSYDPYAIMYRKGDDAFAKVVKDAFQVLAEDGEINRQYKRWFMRRLPSGASMDLPMSPQLESIIQTMAMKAE